VITEKKIAEAKTLEVRAQMEASAKHKNALQRVRGVGQAMIAYALGRIRIPCRGRRGIGPKKILAEAILTEARTRRWPITKQREAIASAGGEAQIHWLLPQICWASASS